VAPSIDVRLRYSATAVRAANGDLVYEGNSYLPKLANTLAIETSVH